MDYLFRYSWGLFIVIGSTAVIQFRRDLGMSVRPKALLGPLLVTNAAWVLMGIQALTNPQVSPELPIDLRHGWLGYGEVASIVVLWAVLSRWLFTQQGVQRLAACPEALRWLRLPQDESSIRLFAVACLAGGVLGLFAIIVVNVGAAP